MKESDFTTEELQEGIAMDAESDAILEQIKPLLAGKDPTLQGAVLGKLIAIWLAGHRPSIRYVAAMPMLEMATRLVPHYDNWPKES